MRPKRFSVCTFIRKSKAEYLKATDQNWPVCINAAFFYLLSKNMTEPQKLIKQNKDPKSNYRLYYEDLKTFSIDNIGSIFFVLCICDPLGLKCG